MADPAKYRTKEEVEEWKLKDPILNLERLIENDYPNAAARFDEIKESVEDEIQDAVQFAHETPDPDPKDVDLYTYI